MAHHSLDSGYLSMGRQTLRRLWVAVPGVGLLALLAAGLTPSSAADQTCIYIVQGLPSRTISVAVDGDSVVGGLAGGKVAGPFPVKHGTRTVTVSEGGQTLVTSKVKLPAGSNSEIVVHLPASPTGDPMITRFDNNLKPVQKGKAAEAFGHVAAAGPIDVRVDKKVVMANIANGEYLYEVVPAGTYKIDVVPTEMTEPLLGPLDLRLKPGQADLGVRDRRARQGPGDCSARDLPLGDQRVEAADRHQHRHGRPGGRAHEGPRIEALIHRPAADRLAALLLHLSAGSTAEAVSARGRDPARVRTP